MQHSRGPPRMTNLGGCKLSGHGGLERDEVISLVLFARRVGPLGLSQSVTSLSTGDAVVEIDDS